MKTCFKCKKLLPINSFYKHKEMFDGHLNKCKECTKLDIRINYSKNKNYYKEYDKLREKNEKRKLNKIIYQKNYRSNNNHKYKARELARRKLTPSSCKFCGAINNIHAHHEDYNDPLNVIWLCQTCHYKVHSEKRQRPF